MKNELMNRKKLPKHSPINKAKMSKHINTHLFFHMNDSSSSKQKDQSSSLSNIHSSKPKKPPSSLISGYEIDTNPPLPSESGDYYDYYTNYGIPEWNYGQLSPSAQSPPYAYYNQDYPDNQATRPLQSSYYCYDRDNSNEFDYYNEAYNSQQQQAYTHGRPYNDYMGESSGSSGAGMSSAGHFNYPVNNNDNNHLQAPLISPPIHDITKHRTSPLANITVSSGDHWSHPILSSTSSSYRNNNDHHQRGLSTFAHKLHRITFVEACIFQPPDLPSPVRAIGRSQGALQPQQPPQQLPQPPLLMQQQGERSPTSTGGTQYYQEWTSKHMRHLCSQFEKPDQQQLLMNVERKSKYPFIILCTPEPTSLFISKSCSSSCSSSTVTSTAAGTVKTPSNHHRYQRELSNNSSNICYNTIDDSDDLNTVDIDEMADDDLLLDDDGDDHRMMMSNANHSDHHKQHHEHWLTQKQRDSVNNHYLPPPPPPLLMPHIWPEIRYIDGLYTVCASIVRPGSGIPCEYDEYLYSDINNIFDQQHAQQQTKQISFQDTLRQQSISNNQKNASILNRPAGYIVSAFATFPGEDSDRLEKNWLLWTGARILYKYLPNCVGLRRLIFLKRCPDMYRDDLMMINQQNQQTINKVKPTIFTGFTYVLLCECFNLKESYIASVCTTIDQLRARCCGYSALYLTHFRQQTQQKLPIQQQQQYHHYQQQQQQQQPKSPSIHHQSFHHPSQNMHHSHQMQPRHYRSENDFNDYDAD